MGGDELGRSASGEALLRVSAPQRGQRHIGHCGLFRFLHQAETTVRLDCAKALGTVAVPAAEHDPDNALAVGFGRRDEQGVGSRAGEMKLRALIQTDHAEAQPHVVVGRRNVDTSGRDDLAVSSERRWEVAARSEDVRQVAAVGTDVPDDEHGRATGGGQSLDDLHKGIEPTVRGGDDDDGTHRIATTAAAGASLLASSGTLRSVGIGP